VRRGAAIAAALGVLASLAKAAPLRPVAASDLEVTTGSLVANPDGSFDVRVPEFRAVGPGTDGDAAELRFVYRGPTEAQSTLGSGMVRAQLGLKLRAADGCNLVYVMWRVAPEAGVFVQLKRNPGQQTHAECANRGYRTISPERAGRVPMLRSGESHVLRAELTGALLVVSADGARVWQGKLPDPSALRGPVGVRTDNVQGHFTLLGRRETKK
jgi:hypothetical protein